MRSQLRAVLGRHHRDPAEDLQAAAEIVTLEGGVGVAPQRCGGRGHLAGFGLDLRLELDRRIGEVVALERLLGDGAARDMAKDKRVTSAASRPARTDDENMGGPPSPPATTARDRQKRSSNRVEVVTGNINSCAGERRPPGLKAGNYGPVAQRIRAAAF